VWVRARVCGDVLHDTAVLTDLQIVKGVSASSALVPHIADVMTQHSCFFPALQLSATDFLCCCATSTAGMA
jgi:hypothetical protein